MRYDVEISIAILEQKEQFLTKLFMSIRSMKDTSNNVLPTVNPNFADVKTSKVKVSFIFQ